MSLSTGRRLAITNAPLIEPRDLSIVAFYLSDRFGSDSSRLIRLADVRDFSDIGFIVDSEDELIEPEDVIKIKQLIDTNFKLVGLPVINEDGKKLGKVEDYAVNTDNFMVEQLNVKKSVLKSFNDTNLLIRRSQIVEVSDDKIIVKSTKIAKEETEDTEQRVFINPFATANPQSDSSELSK